MVKFMTFWQDHEGFEAGTYAWDPIDFCRSCGEDRPVEFIDNGFICSACGTVRDFTEGDAC